MKLSVRQEGDLDKMVADDVTRMERAHTRAMRTVATDFKAAWRDEIATARLGKRLGNTIRSQAYPSGAASLNAAAMVWTKAPHIVSAHDEGALIKSVRGFVLAVPLPAAGRGPGGRRMTPSEFEKRTGQKLRFVPRKGASGLLVVDDARVSKKGQARRKGGRRRKDGILSGSQTVPVFALVPQVKLGKRTDLVRTAEAVAAHIPALMTNWETD